MTITQLAILGGGLIGFGLSLAVWRLVPAAPDLAAALDNLAPERALPRTAATLTPTNTQDRVGLWVMRQLPVPSWWRTPTRELAILRIPPHRYYGEKALYFILGLVFPAALAAISTLFGIALPIAVPLLASLTFAVALSFLPDYNVRSDAAAGRQEFNRALGAYIDLVALERAAGSAPRQAMENAADIGDSWVFKRISEELARSRWSGVTPWNSLTELADELGLPELADVADIMRLSGEESAAVYGNLRARSTAMRDALTNTELAKANAAGERMSIPVALLALVFLVILAMPALLRVVLG